MELLMQIKELAENMGFKVLHGIVDCLWVVGEPISVFRGTEIGYVVKDAKKWEVDPARTAYEFDAGYYKGLLEKAWGEAAFVFTQM
jgi:DNA polymerase elongation subunit (family B)